MKSLYSASCDVMKTAALRNHCVSCHLTAVSLYSSTASALPRIATRCYGDSQINGHSEQTSALETHKCGLGGVDHVAGESVCVLYTCVFLHVRSDPGVAEGVLPASAPDPPSRAAAEASRRPVSVGRRSC